MADVGEEPVLRRAALLGLRTGRRQISRMRFFFAHVAQNCEQTRLAFCFNAANAQAHVAKPQGVIFARAAANANIRLSRRPGERRVENRFEEKRPVAHMHALEQAAA